jgi:Fe-S-cluster containining protein
MSKDLDDGLKFVHTMEMQTKADVHETAATVYALLEELIARGLVDLRTFDERRQRTRTREAERALQLAHVAIDPTPDKYQLEKLPDIDCEARIPLCKGRCCSFVFNLSRQDLDERVVNWDYSRPYQIRRRDDGYCTHSDEKTRGCTVYAHRPSVCRTYDCRNDKRIWKDFDQRIIADENEPATQT